MPSNTDTKKLKKILKEKGITYKQVAEITGLTYNSVRVMMSGKASASKWIKLIIHLNES